MLPVTNSFKRHNTIGTHAQALIGHCLIRMIKVDEAGKWHYFFFVIIVVNSRRKGQCLEQENIEKRTHRKKENN